MTNFLHQERKPLKEVAGSDEEERWGDRSDESRM